MVGLGLAAAMAVAMQSQPAAPEISLADVVRLAIAHSDTLRIATQQLNAAKARSGIAAAASQPHLDATGSATRFDNKTNASLGGETIPVVPIHEEALGMRLSELLDVTGQTAAAVSQARLNTLAAAYDLRSKTEDEVLRARTAYFTALRAQEAVKVAQDALDAYRQQEKTTTQLFEQGVGIRLDVLRSQSQVADAERELVQRQNELSSAISALDDEIGLPLDRPLALSPVATPAPSASDNDLSNRPALIAQALDRRPEMMEATVDVAAARKGIKLAHANAEPIVSVGLSGNYYPTTSFQYIRHGVAEVDVNVQFAIVDGGLTRSRMREAQADVDLSLAQQSQVRRAVSLDVQNAALDAQTAQKRLAAATRSVDAAVSARKLADQRYAGQVAQYIEVTDAQAALTAAEGARVDAYYDLLTAQARLSRAMGEPLPDSTSAGSAKGNSLGGTR